MTRLGVDLGVGVGVGLGVGLGRGARILVTGGAGWIGAALCRRLGDAGAVVRALDDLSRGARAGLAGLNVELLVEDVRSERGVRDAMEGVQAVVHLAAPPPRPRSAREERLGHEVAVSGTLNVLLAARDAKVRRFVYVSSASVYGAQKPFNLHEDLAPHPISAEGAQKLAAEAYVRRFAASGALPTCVLRLFSVYGEGQRGDDDECGFIARLAELARKGQPLVIHGDGAQTRDPIHLDDAIAAIQAAIVSPQAAGRVFNVASGEAVSVRHVAATLTDLAGGRLPPARYLPARPNDPRDVRASIAAVVSGLGFRPRVRLRDGLSRCLGLAPSLQPALRPALEPSLRTPPLPATQAARGTPPEGISTRESPSLFSDRPPSWDVPEQP